MATLRAETRAEHESIERHVALLGEHVTLDAYRAYLARAYGFHAALEPRIAAVPGLTDALPDVAARLRVAALAHDLRDLGVDPAALPLCTELPVLDDVSEALGSLYVLEGSTLGGQVLVRHLRGVLGSTLACRFMGGHAEATGPMWKAFGEHVRTHASAHPEGRYVTAARATFQTFEAWLSASDGSPA